MELVLIRGLPGSGKSTMAKAMEGYEHFEADQYFMTENGYEYDPLQIKDAHFQCQERTYNALRSGRKAVVSNTFTRSSEMLPYTMMAKELGVPVRIIEATGAYPNVHNVPKEVIERMRDRWEPTPEF